MRYLACFDFDRTLYDGFSLNELAESMLSDQLLTQRTLDDMDRTYQDWKVGRLAYEPAVDQILKLWAEGLRGQSSQQVLTYTGAFLSKNNHRVYEYARPLLRQLEKTHDCYLITGGAQFMAQAAGELLSMQGYFGSRFEEHQGCFTGRITSTLAHRDAKKQRVQMLLSRYPHAHSMAFGDAEGDIGMLQSVEHAVCVNATPALTKQATAQGWMLCHPSSVLLEITQLLKQLRK